MGIKRIKYNSTNLLQYANGPPKLAGTVQINNPVTSLVDNKFYIYQNALRLSCSIKGIYACYYVNVEFAGVEKVTK